MKIRKTFQGTAPENKILSAYNNSQTNTYSCQYVNRIGQMIRVYNSTSQTITPTTNTIINFDSVGVVTDSLILKNNQIIVGKGVHVVLVNGRWTAWGTNYSKYVYVHKNEQLMAFHMSPTNTAETTVVFPVEEGDVIDLRCYHDHSANISTSSNANQTFLQVVVLN